MKKLIKNILNLISVNIISSKLYRSNMFLSLKHIKKSGFYPDNVIDVGVAFGTPELYNLFPNSKFFLIEPIKEFNDYLISKIKLKDFKILNICASDSKGTININVRKQLSTSSIHKGSSNVESRKVDTDTIKNIFVNQEIKGSVLLKIDVEGHEINVLKGCGEKLKIISYIIAEVSFYPVLENSCNYLDVIHFMQKNNFKLIDIINLRNDTEDYKLSQADLVFANSSLTN